MEWELLSKTEKHSFSRGTIFRCNGKYPYEKKVDFMLVENPYADSGFAIIVATGQKAGLPLILLPKEAREQESVSVSAAWIKDNWKKWIYELGPDGVQISRNYRIDQN